MESFSSGNPVEATSSLALSQLTNIKAHIDLILLALETLTGIGSEAMLTTATDLGLTETLNDRVSLWRLRQASPLRKGQGRKKLDVEEAYALVLVSCQLAYQHRDQIRQAVTLLETALEQQKPLHRVGVLGDYLDRFNNTYEERMEPNEGTTPEILKNLALKLLIDLLFYSGSGGERKLWLALLDRTRLTVAR